MLCKTRGTVGAVGGAGVLGYATYKFAKWWNQKAIDIGKPDDAMGTFATGALTVFSAGMGALIGYGVSQAGTKCGG